MRGRDENYQAECIYTVDTCSARNYTTSSKRFDQTPPPPFLTPNHPAIPGTYLRGSVRSFTRTRVGGPDLVFEAISLKAYVLNPHRYPEPRQQSQSSPVGSGHLGPLLANMRPSSGAGLWASQLQGKGKGKGKFQRSPDQHLLGSRWPLPWPAASYIVYIVPGHGVYAWEGGPKCAGVPYPMSLPGRRRLRPSIRRFG